MKEDNAIVGGFVAAVLGPLAAAAVLSPFRGAPLSAGILVFTLIVVIATAAALAGPKLGAVATVHAALSFDFVFVRPYGDLKVDRAGDIWPVAVLLSVGVALVGVARDRWPSFPRLAVSPPSSPLTSVPSSRHIQRVVQLVQEGADPRDLISAVQVELTSLLYARSCRFELGPALGGSIEHADGIAKPRLERNGTVAGVSDDLALSITGLELSVRMGPHRIGRFVIDTTPGVPIPLDRRLAAVIVTDHLAAAIGTPNTSIPPRT